MASRANEIDRDMTKEELCFKIAEMPLQKENKSQLMKFVKMLPNSGTKLRPKSFRKGDVFTHPIFNHPCVLARKKGDGEWIAILLTSEVECEENIEKCESRVFVDSFFTKAMFSFKPNSGYIGNMENSKQIDFIYRELKRIL